MDQKAQFLDTAYSWILLSRQESSKEDQNRHFRLLSEITSG